MVIFIANVLVDGGLSVAMQIYFKQLFDVKMVIADALLIINFISIFSFFESASKRCFYFCCFFEHRTAKLEVQSVLNKNKGVTRSTQDSFVKFLKIVLLTQNIFGRTSRYFLIRQDQLFKKYISRRCNSLLPFRVQKSVILVSQI